ncbi:DUF4232 domain-containing protein [Allosphingosinicella sp.]|uniref:DUF4232 domain-containing protein n=1 Tax=Allosphingosinicella sp. TaxID=2823234 RepID=UPI00378445E4
MPFLALLMAAAPVTGGALPACRPAQLRLSTDSGDGEFTGMSHDGVELSLRNRGRDCLLPALPLVELRDARGRVLAARRAPSAGRHPASVIVTAGHRAALTLRWTSGAVFNHSRHVNAARVSVRIGAGMVSAPLAAALYGPAGRPVAFDQSVARQMEGMPADE